MITTTVQTQHRRVPSPITPVAVSPEGATEVVNTSTDAAVRVVNNSADTPAVDVLADGADAVDVLTLPNATAYGVLEAPAGTYN